MNRADLSPTPAQIMADPNAVHINMLHGRIANPSVEQIVHIYAGKVQAVSVEPTPEQIMADPRVKALVDALERIAHAADIYGIEANADDQGADVLAYAHKLTCNLARAAIDQLKEHKP